MPVSPASKSPTAVRARLMRTRINRRILAGIGLGQDEGTDIVPSDFSGDQTVTDFSNAIANLPAPVMNVPLQADTTPLPTVTLENALSNIPGSSTSAVDTYGNQLIGITNPDGSTTITGVYNNVTGQSAAVNPSGSATQVENQISNALSQFSKAAATLMGGTSAQIAAAGQPAGYTTASGISQWLQGSTAEYVVFGGIGFILILALSSRRR